MDRRASFHGAGGERYYVCPWSGGFAEGYSLNHLHESTKSTDMTIYYLCSESRHPTGGIRVIYRHVDILNKHGLPAYVVHSEKGFRAGWFENTTPIVYRREGKFQSRFRKVLGRFQDGRGENGAVEEIPIVGGAKRVIGAEDILVIPEIYGPDLADVYGRGIKKVVLNQSGYLTFKGYSWNKDRLATPYRHKDVLGTLVNSEDSEQYLRYVFPEHPIYRFRLSVDPGLFYYEPEKRKQIVFSRIKNERDAMQVISILKFRGVLRDFDVLPFINIPQREVATIMRESLIFLSFGYPEGFGLPAAEAMACGCVVIGFHGGGGREFFKPEFSFPIEQGDIIGFAQAVERVIYDYERDPARIVAMGRQAAQYIAATYSPQKEEEDLLKAWRAILPSGTLKKEHP